MTPRLAGLVVAVQRRHHRAGRNAEGLHAVVADHQRHGDRDGKRLDVVPKEDSHPAHGYYFFFFGSRLESTERNASWGMDTLPT